MRLLGLMSGTSLDGLDIAYVEITEQSDGQLSFELLAAETYPYPEEWVTRLANLEHASAYEYALAHVQLGHYFGQQINRFRQVHPGQVDAVASHGHTIFHQPQLGLTTQIADGDAIAAETGLPVVFNFRTFDVALGGQGAPLVPIGDQLFYSQYDACLNLGGIANISFLRNARREAFDISPCNMALNHLARLAGQSYDRDGLLAQQGQPIPSLLVRLNQLDYYRLPAPKSLGKEWFVDQFLPLISNATESVSDIMRSVVEHVAQQIALVIDSRNISSMLITGGGAKNKFLIDQLQRLAPQCTITVPADEVIDYKEAIVFALLGYLRIHQQNNCLCSVTGAARDNCGGNIAGL